MIPKIIHYIWFGGKPFPDKVQKCIDSWHKYMPEYEFKLWNEDSFDVNSVEFTKQAYANKKWAFVSDYVRVYALYNYGGWYLDTDIEILRPLASLENHSVILGTDENGELTALMGSEKRHLLWREIIDYYKSITFVNFDGSLNQTVNNKYIQNILQKRGYVHSNIYQELNDGIVIFPDDYFHVLSFMDGYMNKTKNTYAIHWHTLLWMNSNVQKKRWLRTHILSIFIKRESIAKFYILLHKKLKK